LVFLFRQLRSFRCFRSLVGSHISAFNFCKSQSRERVSLGDVAAVAAILDRILHHGHVLRCGPRSWRTKAAGGGQLLLPTA